jgi:hypothetical protein
LTRRTHSTGTGTGTGTGCLMPCSLLLTKSLTFALFSVLVELWFRPVLFGIGDII